MADKGYTALSRNTVFRSPEQSLPRDERTLRQMQRERGWMWYLVGVKGSRKKDLFIRSNLAKLMRTKVRDD